MHDEDGRVAFDFVNHNILLNKLNHLGFEGTQLNLSKTYLLNREERRQVFCVNEKKSDFHKIKHELPQGSNWVHPNVANIVKLTSIVDDTCIS